MPEILILQFPWSVSSIAHATVPVGTGSPSVYSLTGHSPSSSLIIPSDCELLASPVSLDGVFWMEQAVNDNISKIAITEIDLFIVTLYDN